MTLQYAMDDHHPEARVLWEQSRTLVTSNHVLGETWTFLRRRTGHGQALRFTRRVRTSASVEVEHVDELLERDA